MFPSSQRRGGCAINEKPRSHLVRADGVVSSAATIAEWFLNNQSGFRTIEIDNVQTYAPLSTKLFAEEFTILKISPEDASAATVLLFLTGIEQRRLAVVHARP
jgi:hypothetical protein